jgi:hypothetical protein
VIDAEGHPMSLLIGDYTANEPKKGLLWISTRNLGGTIFTTRREATLAAKRTQRYARKNNFTLWPILKGFTVNGLRPKSQS